MRNRTESAPQRRERNPYPPFPRRFLALDAIEKALRGVHLREQHIIVEYALDRVRKRIAAKEQTFRDDLLDCYDWSL